MKPDGAFATRSIDDASSGLASPGASSGRSACTASGALHVEIRTPERLVLRAWADEIVVRDWARPLRARRGAQAFLSALAGGSMIVRLAENVDVMLEFGWGTLACDGVMVRISTSRARLHAVVGQAVLTTDHAPSRWQAAALVAPTPRRLLSATSAA